jgi:hypothetical protein
MHIPSTANVDEVEDMIEDPVHQSAGPSIAATGMHDALDVHRGIRTVAGDGGDISDEFGDGAQPTDVNSRFDEYVRVFVPSTPE